VHCHTSGRAPPDMDENRRRSPWACLGRGEREASCTNRGTQQMWRTVPSHERCNRRSIHRTGSAGDVSNGRNSTLICRILDGNGGNVTMVPGYASIWICSNAGKKLIAAAAAGSGAVSCGARQSPSAASSCWRQGKCGGEGTVCDVMRPTAAYSMSVAMTKCGEAGGSPIARVIGTTRLIRFFFPLLRVRLAPCSMFFTVLLHSSRYAGYSDFDKDACLRTTA